MVETAIQCQKTKQNKSYSYCEKIGTFNITKRSPSGQTPCCVIGPNYTKANGSCRDAHWRSACPARGPRLNPHVSDRQINKNNPQPTQTLVAEGQCGKHEQSILGAQL